MDLALSDEQQALVASFADLLAKHASPERVRAAEPSGFDPALWQALLGIGVVEMAVPESGRGLGRRPPRPRAGGRAGGCGGRSGAGDRGPGRGPVARLPRAETRRGPPSAPSWRGNGSSPWRSVL